MTMSTCPVQNMVSKTHSKRMQQDSVHVYNSLPSLLQEGYIVALNFSLRTCRVLQTKPPTLLAEVQLLSGRSVRQLDSLLATCRDDLLYCPYEQLFPILEETKSSTQEQLRDIHDLLEQARRERRMKQVLYPLHKTLRQLRFQLEPLGWHLVKHVVRGVALTRSRTPSIFPQQPIKHYFLEELPQQYVYGYHSTNKTLTLLAEGKMMYADFPEVQLSSNETCVLAQLFDSWPYYAPIERLRACFGYGSSEQQAHKRLQKTVWQLRRTLRKFPLRISCERGLGYTLHAVSSNG